MSHCLAKGDARYMTRTAHFRFIAIVLCSWTVFATPATTDAQSSRADDFSPLLGGWTLNRDLSARGPAAEPRARGGSEGRRGGRGGSPAGGGSRGGGRMGRSAFDPEQMERARAIVEELMMPSTRWVITRSEQGAIAFTDAEGRSMKFVPDGRKEKHQLAGGTIETQTAWKDAHLRQEISLPGGMKLTRTFAVMPDPRQLVVSTTTEGGRGGRRPPTRFVYEADPGR